MPGRRRAAVAAALVAGLFALPTACGGDRGDGVLAAVTEVEPAVGLDRGIARGRDVVVIVIDTLRRDRLPFYGCSKDTAPFLSSLAERSVVFERAWSTSSWTAPATASLFTSAHPNEHGIEMGLYVFEKLADGGAGIELNRIPGTLETLATFMKAEGYATFGAADNPNIGERLGFDRGFDRFANLPNERGGVSKAASLNAAVLEWAEEIRAAERSFLYLHYMDPHAPYERHEEFLAHPDQVPEDPMLDLDAYDSEIRDTDEHLRALSETLGWDEDTLIVFVSDHGQEFHDHGNVGHGFFLYSELTAVPMFVHLSGEGAPVGRVRHDASLIDVLPTLRALLGAPPSGKDQGVALIDERWATPRAARPMFAMRQKHAADRTKEKRAVVVGRFKLIRDYARDRDELYDIEADPGETEDLAEQRPELVEHLAVLLDIQGRRSADWVHSSAGEFVPTDAEAAMLNNLGYTDDGED